MLIRLALSTLLVLACATGCKKKAAGDKAKPAAAGAFLTVGAYCDTFCGKLCTTCGAGDCATSCKQRCLFNRPADMVMDGKDPKTALALTQKELDACTATITADSCPKIMAGQVPPACFTIQH